VEVKDNWNGNKSEDIQFNAKAVLIYASESRTQRMTERLQVFVNIMSAENC